ncbi:5,6-dimethylbenzimidazole synthase [Streptomyces populi]|uniref:Nicotinate-nucleotide--dimethylbenzimidazole phosphoribosyltransferase n=1 Tax=Streptomyces populi TaxID=2058924 RepID=A0A2I0SWU9_9ACTN|nr:nicotinate-nucleotide--dimethylbenzimidazole phosphoribosyltransferase [Streptomyces populi]PKT74363.1 5,6-dimethylbenzimidazole synthase [Streptomyces populi]
MTDTGQVPGEGLPENAGMVEQPGVAAPGAYTFLDASENPVEDDDLLLLPGAPGAQGAWGNEVPPPAPMPFTDEPGPHETDGRDTGAIDLGAVRAPSPAPVPQPVPQPVAPRRPLHLGPPTPDGSSSPVRSLADRGPAGARPGSMTTPVVPLHQAGPPTVGPEYLDVPQSAEAPPQSAAPWGTVPAGGEVMAAETAAPGTVVPETGQLPGSAVDAEPVPDPELPGAAEAEQAPAVVAEHLVHDSVPAPDAAQAPAPEADAAPLGLQDRTDDPAPEAVPATDGPDAPQFQDAPETPGAPDTADAVTGIASGAETPVPEVVPAQLAEDAGPAVPHAPAEEPVPAEDAAAQAPEQPADQDTDGAGPAEPVVQEAEPVAPAPEQAVPLVDEASLPGDEQPVGAPVPHPYETPDSALSALSARSADASQSGQDITPDAAEAQQFTDRPAPAENGAVPAEEAAAHDGTDLPGPGSAETPQAAPVEADAPTEAVGRADGDPHPESGTDPAAGVPGFPGAPVVPQADQSLGHFVPVEGTVPTAAHLAPTPPHGVTVPPAVEEQPPAQEPAQAAVTVAPVPAEETPVAEAEPVAQASVPAPREAEAEPEGVSVPQPLTAEPEPVAAQQAEDLRTQGADQEEGTAVVEEVRESTGPAAPGFNDAEREAVLRVIRERRDIRNGFRDDPIPHDVLLRVLEAAHTAPSVGHSQPWDFVVIRSAETRRSMHELAQRQREAYAKSLPKGRAKQFKEMKIEAILDTPVNVVVTADPTRGGRHTLGRHTQPQMAPYSAALAVENFWLAARAEGLGVGWVSFFDEREMVRALGLPDHLEVVAYLCVGYVDEFPEEPELMQAGWSKRRPLSWVVHEETYGRRALPGEEPHDLLAETVSNIRPLDAKALGEAWERQKRMTKPAGALGMLEIISAQLSGLSRMCPPPIPEPAAVAIFAGDHGVHAQGVTPWPQEVTGQMVANFLGGGAVCNAFANQVGAEVCVVDVGVASDLPATPGLLPRKVRAGTADMTTGPAMTREEAVAALEVGIETARDLVAAGNKALLTGEMGIANTTASAALISVFTGADPAEVTGRGTGINDETLARKTEVVRRAIEFHQPDPADPIGVLAAIGGLEHAAMVGLLLGGASLRTPVILDGVSAGAAALVARAIAPEVLAACIAGHRSAEPGHVAALNKLGLRPLIDLDLRLGEGTGALLALPVVQSAARAMHEVATFDSAGVTEK